MNKISLTGRLAADAEVRFIASGEAVCNFRIGSDIGFGAKKTTNWFNCQLWGKRGESISPFLIKGQQVTIFGSLTLREWQNKDGVKQLSPDVRVDEIELQGGKHDSQHSDAHDSATEARSAEPAAQHAKPQQRAQQYSTPDNFVDSDVPFSMPPRKSWLSI